MARTKNFDENKVLESAMLLFWKKGYSATSMKELEYVMGLKPTSIYNAFGSKRDLFKKALNTYLQTVLARFIESLVSAKSAKDALKGVLDEVIHLHFSKSHPGGCMVVLSLLESEQHDAKTKKILDSALFRLRDTIAHRLEQAQKAEEIRPDTDCQIVANHVIALITGMISMAKAGFCKRDLKILIDSSLTTLIQQYW